MRMNVKLVDGVEYLPITCAVCENLSNAMILGADVVAKIHEKLLNERYMPNVNCGVGDVDKTYSPFDVDVDNVAIDTKQVDSNKTDADFDDDVIDSDANDDGVLNADDTNVDNHTECNESCKLSAESLKQEQENDRSLKVCWDLARRGKSGYFVREGILYRNERIFGHYVEQLVLPQSRRMQAIRLAHDVYGGHLATKKTKARLKLSFTWPTIAIDVQKACETCDRCQKRKRDCL